MTRLAVTSAILLGSLCWLAIYHYPVILILLLAAYILTFGFWPVVDGVRWFGGFVGRFFSVGRSL